MANITITPRYKKLANTPWGMLNLTLALGIKFIGAKKDLNPLLLDFPQTNERAARTAYNYVAKNAPAIKSLEVKLYIKTQQPKKAAAYEEILKINIETGHHQFSEIVHNLFFNEGILINDINSSVAKTRG